MTARRLRGRLSVSTAWEETRRRRGAEEGRGGREGGSSKDAVWAAIDPRGQVNGARGLLSPIERRDRSPPGQAPPATSPHPAITLPAFTVYEQSYAFGHPRRPRRLRENGLNVVLCKKIRLSVRKRCEPFVLKDAWAAILL